jgi:hypothetical protein
MSTVVSVGLNKAAAQIAKIDKTYIVGASRDVPDIREWNFVNDDPQENKLIFSLETAGDGNCFYHAISAAYNQFLEHLLGTDFLTTYKLYVDHVKLRGIGNNIYGLNPENTDNIMYSTLVEDTIQYVASRNPASREHISSYAPLFRALGFVWQADGIYIKNDDETVTDIQLSNYKNTIAEMRKDPTVLPGAPQFFASTMSRRATAYQSDSAIWADLASIGRLSNALDVNIVTLYILSLDLLKITESDQVNWYLNYYNNIVAKSDYRATHAEEIARYIRKGKLIMVVHDQEILWHPQRTTLFVLNKGNNHFVTAGIPVPRENGIPRIQGYLDPADAYDQPIISLVGQWVTRGTRIFATVGEESTIDQIEVDRILGIQLGSLFAAAPLAPMVAQSATSLIQAQPSVAVSKEDIHPAPAANVIFTNVSKVPAEPPYESFGPWIPPSVKIMSFDHTLSTITPQLQELLEDIIGASLEQTLNSYFVELENRHLLTMETVTPIAKAVEFLIWKLMTLALASIQKEKNPGPPSVVTPSFSTTLPPSLP